MEGIFTPQQLTNATKYGFGEGNDNSFQYFRLENHMGYKPVGLQSTGSQGVRHDWATEYACMPALICCFVDLKNISNEDYKVAFILWKV